MNKCVFYLRDEVDNIQRLDSVGEVSLKGLSGSYLFEEALTNFPETTVFWSMESGACVGVAPVFCSIAV
jgi:hypothetical protein